MVEEILAEGTYEMRRHPDQARYPGQVLLLFEFREYTWVCPADSRADRMTLRTIYPSRKYHREGEGMADSTLTCIDDDEHELIDSIEGAPQFGQPLEPEEERRIRELLTVAARRKPKDTKITMRISSDDLVAIKALARRLGVEYQPLIAEVIHQYARGRLRRSG